MRGSEGKKAHVLKCIIPNKTKYLICDLPTLQSSSAKRSMPSTFVALALFVVMGWAGVARAQWTQLTNSPGQNLGTCMVLTDGRVMCHQFISNAWLFLTPDINGSYVNGTWSTSATMPNGTDTTPACTPSCPYQPLYFGSSVLADGQVVVVGGEYNPSSPPVWTNIGFMYDPVADSWSA